MVSDSSQDSKERFSKTGSTASPNRRDTRSPLAKGWAIGSEVVGLSLQFAVPLFGGFLIDRWLGSAPAATILGGAFGLAAAILGFVAFIRRLDRQSEGGQEDSLD